MQYICNVCRHIYSASFAVSRHVSKFTEIFPPRGRRASCLDSKRTRSETIRSLKLCEIAAQLGGPRFLRIEQRIGSHRQCMVTIDSRRRDCRLTSPFRDRRSRALVVLSLSWALYLQGSWILSCLRIVRYPSLITFYPLKYVVLTFSPNSQQLLSSTGNIS
ncbi:hypothetical protein BDQ12DRAFT_428391 [Crucibulum laeve]|uniref:Uncharacterized protein n=1 Tax=Crucibulum laeve TaxID=68775 RepID=A0A5C3MBI0_9AGAR|nr:hypothetical protein BDQ12DRAFT_428391 [Crucibulum laeve]